MNLLSAFLGNGSPLFGPASQGSSGQFLASLGNGRTEWQTIDLSGYATTSSLTAAFIAHLAALDPHPQYLTQSEGDGRYPFASAGLAQFAAGSTSSDELRALLTDETGTGAAVFGTGPTLSGVIHSGTQTYRNDGGLTIASIGPTSGTGGSLRIFRASDNSRFGELNYGTGGQGFRITDTGAYFENNNGSWFSNVGISASAFTVSNVENAFRMTDGAGQGASIGRTLFDGGGVVRVYSTAGGTALGAMVVGSPNITTPALTIGTLTSQGSTPALRVMAPNGSTVLGSWGSDGSIVASGAITSRSYFNYQTFGTGSGSGTADAIYLDRFSGGGWGGPTPAAGFGIRENVRLTSDNGTFYTAHVTDYVNAVATDASWSARVIHSFGTRSGLQEYLRAETSGVTVTGNLTVRQPGGTAGTHEVRSRHTGSRSEIQSMFGDLGLIAPAGQVIRTLASDGSRAGIVAGSFFVGDFNNWYVNQAWMATSRIIAFCDDPTDNNSVFGSTSALLERSASQTMRVRTGQNTDAALRVGSPNVSTPGLTIGTVASQGTTPAARVLAPNGSTVLSSWGSDGSITFGSNIQYSSPWLVLAGYGSSSGGEAGGGIQIGTATIGGDLNAPFQTWLRLYRDGANMFHVHSSGLLYLRSQSGDVIVRAGGADHIRCFNGGGVTISAELTLSSAVLSAANLPTTDPAVTGRVWLDSGLLRLSGTSGGGGGGALIWTEAEVSITGAATATANRWNRCTGTSVDYTLTLPSAASNSGAYLGVVIDATCTKFVTTNGWKLREREWVLLRSDGTNWVRLASRFVPLVTTMSLSTVLDLATNTWTPILCDVSTINPNAMVNTSNGRLTLPRAGAWKFSVRALVAGNNTITTGLSGSATTFQIGLQRDSEDGVSNRDIQTGLSGTLSGYLIFSQSVVIPAATVGAYYRAYASWIGTHGGCYIQGLHITAEELLPW